MQINSKVADVMSSPAVTLTSDKTIMGGYSILAFFPQLTYLLGIYFLFGSDSGRCCGTDAEEEDPQDPGSQQGWKDRW